MKEDVKQRWIEALRSGKYKQARQSLCDIDGAMCCLGVLSFIETGDARTWQELSGTEYLNSEALNTIALTEEQQHKLASMNDGNYDFETGKTKGRKTFKGIATYIEKNL